MVVVENGWLDRGKAGEMPPPAVTLIAIPRDNNGRRGNSWAALCFSWVFVFLLVYFTFVCRGGVGIFTLVWFYYVFLWDRTGPHFPTRWPRPPTTAHHRFSLGHMLPRVFFGYIWLGPDDLSRGWAGWKTEQKQQQQHPEPRYNIKLIVWNKCWPTHRFSTARFSFSTFQQTYLVADVAVSFVPPLETTHIYSVVVEAFPFSSAGCQRQPQPQVSLVFPPFSGGNPHPISHFPLLVFFELFSHSHLFGLFYFDWLSPRSLNVWSALYQANLKWI